MKNYFGQWGLNNRKPEDLNFGQLNKLLNDGKLIPFLGAGASMPDNAGEELSESIPFLRTSDYWLDDPEEMASESFRYPTGSELAQFFALYHHLPKDEVNQYNLLEVASYLALEDGGRIELDHALASIFKLNQAPGLLHRYLASISSPLLIVTTNYDTLIERAFLDVGREFHLIMTPTWYTKFTDDHGKELVLWWAPGAKEPSPQPRQFQPAPKDIPVIYKLHGGLDASGRWCGSVIAEDDYFEIGGRIYESTLLPAEIQSRLANDKLLFLGYTLRDIHVRQLIYQLKQSRSDSDDPIGFWVSKAVSEFYRERFGKRDLEIYEMTITKFVEGLKSVS